MARRRLKRPDAHRTPVGYERALSEGDWFHASGRLGFAVQRHRDDTDSFYEAYQDRGSSLFMLHDVYFGAGPSATFVTGAMQVDVSYQMQVEYNRYAVGKNDHRNHRIELRSQIKLP